MIRIAFTLIGGKKWTGGYNYLLNLLRALDSNTDNHIQPILFLGKDIPEGEINPFYDIYKLEIVIDPAFNEKRKSTSLLRSIILGSDRKIVAAFRDHRINLLFENALFLGWNIGIPSIGWIPDLQHRYLPQLFGFRAYWKREIGFLCQILSGRFIMLSSSDSRRSCELFYPYCRSRTHTVRFAVPPPRTFDFKEARTVADRYNLPEKYFFMPNQFWRHKNHKLVIEALDILKRNGRRDIFIVSTGQTHEPRGPAHFLNLKREIEERGLDQNFIILGLIPYSDLMPLMQSSEALLNPSLSEGWSTTVEEAKAAGKSMLLSDLAVHYEQTNNAECYFDRYNPESLATKLANYRAPSAPSSGCLRNAASKRISEFANSFVSLTKRARRQPPVL